MFNTTTPNAKFPIEGDRMYPSPCNPPADVRHVGRQASSGYDYNKPYPSPDDNAMNFAIVKRFVMNQPVNVNIEGSGWLVGTVVAILTAVKTLTGSRVRVRYSAPHDSQERTTEVPDDPRFIRPLNYDQMQAVKGR